MGRVGEVKKGVGGDFDSFCAREKALKLLLRWLLQIGGEFFRYSYSNDLLLSDMFALG